MANRAKTDEATMRHLSGLVAVRREEKRRLARCHGKAGVIGLRVRPKSVDGLLLGYALVDASTGEILKGPRNELPYLPLDAIEALLFPDR
jgi:hypothetical protein